MSCQHVNAWKRKEFAQQIYTMRVEHEYCPVLDLNLNEFFSLIASALTSLDIYSASLCIEYLFSSLTFMVSVSKEKLPKYVKVSAYKHIENHETCYFIELRIYGCAYHIPSVAPMVNLCSYI